MMTDLLVRPYAPRDRAQVRMLCCETADLGNPVERFFGDREVFADLVTGYYLDEEPASTWVAEQAGRVLGYLTGCLDTRRYRRRLTWFLVPRTVWRALGRGTFLSPKTWRLLGAGVKTWLQGGFQRRVPLERYPAHFHVNVAQDARGQRVGQQLVERFLEQLKRAGIAGVHVVVRGDNAPACRFFERLGFTALSRHPVIRSADQGGQMGEVVVYGKRV